MGWGPSLIAREASGSGTVGRKPGVRPVLEPVVARRSVEAMGERSKSGPGTEGRGEVALVVILGDEVAEVLEKTCYGRLAMEQGAKNRGAGTHGR